MRQSDKIYRIICQRKVFNTEGDRSTIGEVFCDGEFFCYSLEDECRFDGDKVYGQTAIPAIEYNVTVNHSSTFKRKMILLYNKPDYSIQHEGVKFTGVRVHGGNTAKDSHGCPIVAKNTNGIKVWSSAEDEITSLVEQKIADGYSVKWKVEMKPFNPTLDNKLIA